MKGSYKDDGAKLFLVVPKSIMRGHSGSLDIRKKNFSKRVVQSWNKSPEFSQSGFDLVLVMVLL